MAEDSGEKNNKEKKRTSKGRNVGMTASIALALLAVLTATQTAQIGSALASNEDLSYPRDKNALQEVQVGDIHMAYRMFGKGEPIVLVHGYGGSMDIWDPTLLNDLAQNRTVIVFNNRGVGNSTLGEKNYSIEQLAEDTVGLLDVLGIKNVDVLSWSMGGMIAQELAINHPDKVNRLVLYGSTCGGNEYVLPEEEVLNALADESGTAAERMARFMPFLFPEEWREADPNYFMAIPKNTQLTSNQTLSSELNAALNWKGTCDQLQRIDRPTLVVVGSDDSMMRPANSLTIAERIPGAWLVQIQDGGHGLMYQHPEKLSEAVSTFLETT
ncbi:MAG TPA: alpha/beta hydrolase [Nitrososphaera sp.]